jgi:Prophage antirepressor
MSDLTVFNNEEFGQVRTVKLDSEIYFVGKDVAAALGYKDSINALKQHVDDDDKLGWQITTSGQKRNVTIINESGLYSLILGSKLENAKKFKRWVTSEVLPNIRKTGSYETPKSKASAERLASINNAVKILTPLLEKAGCNSQIQLLTAKSLYEKAGVDIPIDIEADKQYFDTVHIARRVGIYVKSSGKPAGKAVNEIIRRIDIADNEYVETYESKEGWQGTVRKYAETVIDRISNWISDNDYPPTIQYKQTDEQVKGYHVTYKIIEVA